MDMDQILRNTALHDKIAKKYDEIHGEIFNVEEQNRLKRALAQSLSNIDTGTKRYRALDFGCGTGNLTRHLIELGVDVTAADVSRQSLVRVKERFEVETVVLNGKDLSDFSDDSFDFVACYSVLHHVPDYLHAVSEMARVSRPGGCVYIDHEPIEEYWTGIPGLDEFRKKVEKPDFSKYFHYKNYVDKLIRVFNPRHTNEGDIHVWPDDHIEWPLVIETLGRQGFEIVFDDAFLLCRRNYREDVYWAHRDTLHDTRVMAFRKTR